MAQKRYNTLPPEDPWIYRVFFQKIVGLVGRATIHTNLQIQFVNHHMRDKIVIMEEVN